MGINLVRLVNLGNLPVGVSPQDQSTQENVSVGRFLHPAAKEAQGLLDEANGIHATPEVTEALIASVNQQHADIEQQNALIEQLATNEKSLRDSTRGKRVMFIGVIAAAVVLLIVILFLIFGPK